MMREYQSLLQRHKGNGHSPRISLVSWRQSLLQRPEANGQL